MWEGRADTSRLAIVDAVPAELAGRALEGPTAIACVWIRDKQAIRDPGFLATNTGCRSLLLLTNQDLGLANMRWRFSGDELAIAGPERLGHLLDEHPLVRRRVPSVLGVRDLSALLTPDVVDRSSWDEQAARSLAQVFVPTRTYRAALHVLERHHFTVLSGPPEMGKTAIARTIGLALQTEGWEVHECTRPEQVWEALARDRPQLFVADDAFGSTEYRPDAAERWALDLDRILQTLDHQHWLIWTSRPAPLKAGLGRIRREHGIERFPEPTEVNVDAASLDVEEKALILYRHARAAALDPRAVVLVQQHGARIVDHPHFTPERINRFVRIRLPSLVGTRRGALRAAIDAEIAEPTAAMTTSLEALAPEQRALLVALLDAPPGPVAERDLASAARRHAPHGLPRPPAELVDRLTDHFLRVVPPTSVTWVHPSWRDLVIEQLAADAKTRRGFLQHCSLEGVLLAVSREGGRAGERRRPLLVNDGDWDALSERLYELMPELADADLMRLLAVLEDELLGADRENLSEVEALAGSALDRIATCWERGVSFASESLLDRWREVASRLPEQPRHPLVGRLWELPPRNRRGAPMLDELPLRTRAGELNRATTGEQSIVSRILADL